MITQTQEDAILKEIWKGIYTVDNLPVPVYEENLKELTKGVAEGWGVALKDIPKERLKFKTLDSLVNNVDSFSAAKTFHQVADMEFLKVDKAGNIIPFSKFKKEAGTVFNTYNRTWLKTEFNTSKSQSQSAAQWSRIQAQKKDLPLLQYQTSGDERVRDEHVAWDGIIKPVDDPFWNTVSAPNGYNCRCEIIQLSSGKPTNLDTHLKKVNTQFKKEGKKPLKNLNNTAPLFSDNVGKTGQVFNKNEHPYFDAPKSKLDTNFGLPVTQTLLKKVVKPKKFTPAKTIKEAEDYSKSLGIKSFKTDIAEDSLDAINAANKGFNDLKNAGHNLGDLNISFIDARARHMAHYIKARKEISFNPISWGRTNKQIDWNVKNSKDTGFYSVNDRSSLVIHEFGHHKHLNHLETLDFKEAAKTQFGKLSKQETELITKEVGKYASENPLEFVAETFTGMTYGKKYSKEIIKLYDKHHGMKIKTIKK